MNIIVERQYYSPKRCKDNPQNLYIFGENEEQKGTNIRGAGQAIIRPENNSFGFCTKRSIYEYWTDEEFEDNVCCIEEDIEDIHLIMQSKQYDGVVFPINGLGTGLSQLPQKAPRTFIYLCRRLLEEFDFNNLQNLKTD
jgi:hypothetical protein